MSWYSEFLVVYVKLSFGKIFAEYFLFWDLENKGGIRVISNV